MSTFVQPTVSRLGLLLADGHGGRRLGLHSHMRRVPHTYAVASKLCQLGNNSSRWGFQRHRVVVVRVCLAASTVTGSRAKLAIANVVGVPVVHDRGACRRSVAAINNNPYFPRTLLIIVGLLVKDLRFFWCPVHYNTAESSPQLAGAFLHAACPDEESIWWCRRRLAGCCCCAGEGSEEQPEADPSVRDRCPAPRDTHALGTSCAGCGARTACATPFMNVTYHFLCP